MTIEEIKPVRSGRMGDFSVTHRDIVTPRNCPNHSTNTGKPGKPQGVVQWCRIFFLPLLGRGQLGLVRLWGLTGRDKDKRGWQLVGSSVDDWADVV